MRGALDSSARWRQALAVQCALALFHCVVITLGCSGCMLDTKPLQGSSPRPTETSVSTSAETGGQPSMPDPQRDAQVGIITGNVCTDDASSCLAHCSADSDCPAASACHAAVCVEGACKEEPLLDASSCDDDAGSCPAGECGTCVAGASECVGAGLRSCGKDGRWTQALRCEHGCSAGACNECTPDATQCSASNEAQRCAANGRWAAKEVCSNGCANGRCKVCTEGAKRCTADAQETCSAEGAWVSTPCSLGCVDNHCAACKVGASECTGSDMNSARVCGDNGEWGPAMACASTCADGQCTECVPSTQRCAGPGIQVCGLDRRWLTTESCPNGCDGMRCAACKEGALECPSRTTVRVCRNHMWSDTDNCRPNAHCSAEAPSGNTCPCDSGFVDPHPNPGLCMAGR